MTRGLKPGMRVRIVRASDSWPKRYEGQMGIVISKAGYGCCYVKTALSDRPVLCAEVEPVEDGDE